MGQYAAAAAVVVAVVGTVMSSNSQKKAANAQADADNYNAAIAQRNTAFALAQNARDVEQLQRQGRMSMGQARASYGASGITSEGSPMDVLAQSAAQVELDVQNLKYKGVLRAQGYTEESALSSASAQNALARGNQQASATLLGGVGKAYDAYSAYKGFSSTPTVQSPNLTTWSDAS